MMQPIHRYAPFVTRIGLAGVLLWFGFEQLMHAADWTGYIPELALSVSGMDARTLVLMNGAIEVACGAMLVIGLYTRLVAFVMGAHLVLIALSLGNSAVAVRDWGLAFAFFGLVLSGAGAWSLDAEETLHIR